MGTSKQDRQGARTPADLEQRYNFGKTFAEVYGLAESAQTAASDAKVYVDKLDNSLTQEEIFNRLTKNGELQGVYMEDGELYINAKYIKSGKISSANGESYFDLDDGTFYSKSDDETAKISISMGHLDVFDENNEYRVFVGEEWDENLINNSFTVSVSSEDGERLVSMNGYDSDVTLCAPNWSSPDVHEDNSIRWETVNGAKVLTAGNATALSDAISPAMTLNTEYRTTERWQGKPVYRKLVSYTNAATIGNSTDVTNFTAPHNISGFSEIVRVNGKVGTYILPYIGASGNLTGVVSVDANGINLRTVKTDWSPRTWYFDLAYTKT